MEPRMNKEESRINLDDQNDYNKIYEMDMESEVYL